VFASSSPCKIELVSRLCSKVMGFLVVPDKSLTAFQQVRNLQQQVSLLCPHATRTHEDILLFVGQVQVGPPNMAYVDDLDVLQSFEVLSFLKETKSTKSIQFMWDEDDTYAKSVVSNVGDCTRSAVLPAWNDITIYCSVLRNIPHEFAYFSKQVPIEWTFYTSYASFTSTDVGFLKRVATIPFICLDGVYPTEWSDVNAQRLVVCCKHCDCSNLVQLDKVTHLQLDCYASVSNLRSLERLVNLESICLTTRRDEGYQDFLHLVRNSRKIKAVDWSSKHSCDNHTAFVRQLLDIPRLEYINVQGTLHRSTDY
jgi:hypothetical protein